MRKEPYVIYAFEKLKSKYSYVSQMEIYKILYFAKAYSLSQGHESEFNVLEFEAWLNGPVLASERNDIVHNFYASIESYKNFYKNSSDFEEIDENEKSAIDYIIGLMGDLSAKELSLLSHGEGIKKIGIPSPWEEANPTQTKCKKKISSESMKNYYTSNFFTYFKKNKESIVERLNV